MLTGCGAVARGSRGQGHIGAAAGGVVGVRRKVCAQEAGAQDDCVVGRPGLKSQHAGGARYLHDHSASIRRYLSFYTSHTLTVRKYSNTYAVY